MHAEAGESAQPGPDPATDVLLAAFRAASDTDPATLYGPTALARARALLRLSEQVMAVVARAVADVEARELFVLDEAGGTRSWLRTQPCGEGQHLTRARQLGRHPGVAAAVCDGAVSSGTAATVCAQLDRVPDEVPDDQLLGLLVHGVPDLLSSWTGGLVLDDLVTEELIARREEAAAVLRACADDVLSPPAARLEPVFLLLARTVTPAHLQSSLQALVDALLPEQLADDAEQDHDATYVRLRKVISGGWDLLVHLDDTAGQELAELLEAKVTALLRGSRAGGDEGVAQQELGLESLASDEAEADEGEAETDEADPAAGATVVPVHSSRFRPCPVRSRGQELYDAFVALLVDATAGLGRGEPRPANLTIVSSLGALEGRPGAPPALLTTARGAVPLPAATVQRLGCDGVLSAVLLDAAGNPVGASGSHRHATRRERRALRAQWGPTCAVLGCATTAVVPHHVEPWWLSRRTWLRDLLPVCEHHHRDVHEGQRTLRIRDGRTITPTGWGGRAAAAA